MIIHVAICFFNVCECQEFLWGFYLFIYFFLWKYSQKKLCVLIAPRAHEDKDKSVNGGAKNGVKWCIAIPVLGLELL